MNTGIATINDRVRDASAFAYRLREEIAQVVVGQRYLVDRLLIGLLTGGHVLLEGVPGLAKTLSVKTLAQAVRASFRRIQFTPDLLPADLIGTLVYNPREGTFSTKRGPIFAQLVLADEINRAPAKVQSALLEAMQERQILDRMATTGAPRAASPVIGPEDITEARRLVDQIYVDEKIKEYIVDVVFATRDPAAAKLDLAPLIEYGASPRATLALTLCAKAHAFLEGRGYVTPQDVKSIGHDVLRHRVVVTYEAEAEDLDADEIVRRVFDGVPVP